MKVKISYELDLEDLPKQIGDLVNILKESDINLVTNKMSCAESACYDKNISMALTEIDKTRILLGKIDQKLMNYSTILASYAKADAEIQMGTQPADELQQREVSNDQIDSSSESEPEG